MKHETGVVEFNSTTLGGMPFRHGGVMKHELGRRIGSWGGADANANYSLRELAAGLRQACVSLRKIARACASLRKLAPACASRQQACASLAQAAADLRKRAQVCANFWRKLAQACARLAPGLHTLAPACASSRQACARIENLNPSGDGARRQ